MQDAVRFAKQYHDADLHVGVYVYSGAFLWEPMYREVPESQNWVILDKNYKPLDYYNAGIRYRWNRNHPDAQSFYEKIIGFAVKEIKTDMLHFDNHGTGPGCDAYSVGRFREYLRNTFTPEQLQEMGAADLLQVVPPMGGQSYKRSNKTPIIDHLPRTLLDYAWLEFTAQSLADGYYDMGRYARSLRKDILLELNCGGAGNFIQPPKDHGRLLQGGDASWSEGEPSGYYDGAYHTRIKSYKVARSMDNLVFFYAETPLSMAESMAFNSDCLGMICQFRNGNVLRVPEKRREPVSEEVIPYIDFYRSRRTLFREAEVIADVAVLRSYPSQVFADPSYAQLTSRAEQVCINKQIPFQIVHAHQLTNLDRYRVLTLAGCVALSDMQIRQILEFVNQGGRLCVIGPVATHNEWMVPRQDDPFSSVPKDRIVQTGKDGDIANALLQSADGRFSASIAAPEGLYAEYTETTEGRLVHLVNFRPEQPVTDTKVCMRVSEGQSVKRVRLASPGRSNDLPVKFKKEGGSISFTVPEVGTYEVAIVEL
jgi:hypothetical protein